MLTKSEISNLFQIQFDLEMQLHSLKKSPEENKVQIEQLEQQLAKCEHAIEQIIRS